MHGKMLKNENQTVAMTDRSKTPLVATAHDSHGCRLFVGKLPKVKTEKEILDEVCRITRDRPVRAITYKDFDRPSTHRGFCFLDYGSAAAAANAMRTLSRCKLFGCKTVVDWAHPRPQPKAMPKVRVLFVRQSGGVLDERVLARKFGRYGAVERVKVVNSYAYVHFERREDAQSAMYALDGAQDVATGVRVDVAWAKSPADKNTQQQRMLRDRERRVQKSVPRPPAAHVVSEANGRAATTAAAITPSATTTVTTSGRGKRSTGVPRMSSQRPLPSPVPCPISATVPVHVGAATTAAARARTSAKRSVTTSATG